MLIAERFVMRDHVFDFGTQLPLFGRVGIGEFTFRFRFAYLSLHGSNFLLYGALLFYILTFVMGRGQLAVVGD